MPFPLISEYIEAIKSAEDNFEELTNLRAVLGDDGQPVMTSGNFAVVFKMQDIETGKYYAVKCFTKDQEGRENAYHQIVEELKNVESPYLISIRYIDKELFVDSNQTTETEFPVLLMDWVEGKTLDKYLRDNLNKKKTMEKFVSKFYLLAKWLIAQPFAHGDLKPDNILVNKDGNLVLIDYDGMYVPAMNGQKSREVGSPDFCHPRRSEGGFDEHVDDFSILSILLSLCVLLVKPNFLKKYGAEDRLLFSKNDYVAIHNSILFQKIPSIIETSTNYKLLFGKACKDSDFQLKTRSLTPVDKLIKAMAIQKVAVTRTVNDVELANLGIKTDIDPVGQYIWKTSNNPIVQYNLDKSSSHKFLLEKEKREKATKWQAALLLVNSN